MDELHHDLLARVSTLYYEDDRTQGSIAQELGISRVKVYRLLKEARAQGVVEITVHWQVDRDKELEDALANAFGLDTALVLRVSQHYDPGRVLANLGELVARELGARLADGMSLAICLGRSTYAAIEALPAGFQPRIKVVQAIGSMPTALGEVDSSELVRRLGQKVGVEVTYLPSPPVADNVSAAAVLRRQPEIRDALVAAREADVALVGIGNLQPGENAFVRAGYITTSELQAVKAAGAVGEVVGWPYDISGEVLANRFTERLIGIRLEELGRIPTTFGVAAGLEKLEAILGALQGGWIRIFATDSLTASAVLSRRKGDEDA
jgi:DNA-binding transcriptional regulator LsrR (DeoR family)